MPLLPKLRIRNLQTSRHGGLNHAEIEALGLKPDEVLDFSVNFNPFGPSPKVKEALNKVVINRYPDPEATQLRRNLAGKLGVSSENILVGNGSTELVRLIASAYLELEDYVLIIEPAFEEYRVASEIAGAKILRQWRSENFKLRIEETLSLIKQNHPKLIFLCNPNNPTGDYLEKEEVLRILSVCEKSLLILDEAYISFVEDAWSSLDLIWEKNLLVLRSMTKDFALAGLRLGYTIAHHEIIALLRKVFPPWNVNAAAQLAGILALEDLDYLKQSRIKTQELKDFLIKELRRIGFTPLPSQANFFLINVGDAKEFRSQLLKKKILVRDCSSFSLPQYARISPRTFSECQRLIAEVKEIKHERRIAGEDVKKD